MEKDRIANRVYVGECAGSHSMGRLRKMDSYHEGFRKKGLNVRQARKRVQDMSE